MTSNRWGQRFFSTTRGQIVSLLRRAGQTVDDLASALELTDNAVRSHLATLERDGLVVQRGARRGRGKPALAYELTPEAETLFPKAHAAVLGAVLDVVTAELGPERVNELLRHTGRHIGAGRQPPADDEQTRLAAAITTLNELGGLVELEERAGVRYLHGYSCPLGTAAREHPELCQFAEALVSELVGQPVRECCDRGERPRCCFQIEVADAPAS